jgi:hypothetical protein
MKELVYELAKKSGKSEKEIIKMAEKKIEEFSGLVSIEGALYILAKDLGVIIEPKSYKKDIKIENLVAGIKRVDIKAKVAEKSDIREFVRNDGSVGKVESIILADETGAIRLSLWDDQIEKFNLEEGSFVEIRNAYCVENSLGDCELRFGDRTQVKEIEEAFEVIPVLKTKRKYKAVENLNFVESGGSYEVIGTITQIFSPTHFKVCEICEKKMNKDVNGVYLCEVHKEVGTKDCPVVSLIIDDGWSTMRISAFRDLAKKFVSEDSDKIGYIIMARGFIKKNAISGDLEMSLDSYEVFKDVEVLKNGVELNE